MDDEAEHEHRVVVGGAELEVAEALSEAVSELELVEEKLKDDEPSERGELLVIESDSGRVRVLRWVLFLVIFTEAISFGRWFFVVTEILPPKRSPFA
jgi:hypothetical protein